MNAASVIENVDMSAIWNALISKGMADLEADAACEAGRRDLIVAAENLGTPIVPTLEGDEVVHVLLGMPELVEEITLQVAGPGFQFVHDASREGDWAASEAMRIARFGDRHVTSGRAGCIILFAPLQ